MSSWKEAKSEDLGEDLHISLAKVTEVAQKQGAWGQPQIQEQQCGFVPEREIVEQFLTISFPLGAARALCTKLWIWRKLMTRSPRGFVEGAVGK